MYVLFPNPCVMCVCDGNADDPVTRVCVRISDPFRPDGNIRKEMVLFTNETYSSNMYF